MKYIKLLALLLATIFVFGACNRNRKQENTIENESEQKVVDTRIDTVFALFYNYQFESPSPISPETLKKDVPDFTKDSYHGVIDATISDTSKIRKIKDQIDLLRPSGDNVTQDARIALTIKHKDGSYSYLTLCGTYADQIFYNNIRQEANNKLVFYIKNYIGYYPWFIGDGLYSMPELNDSSFPKEPFVSDEYYKKYQEALASR